MYAFVKASVLFLLAPLSLALILLGAGLVFLWAKPGRRTGPVLLGCGVSVLVLFSLPFIPDALLGRLEQAYPPVDPAAASIRDLCADMPYVVVLAGGHGGGPGVPITSRFTHEGLVRLIEGIRLWKHCGKARLILSGGCGEDGVSDAQLMYELAVQLGVRREDVILEPYSVDTYDEAALLKGVLRGDRFFLVTSAFHMPRAMAIFTRQGMRPVAAPAGHYVVPGGRAFSFVPEAQNLLKCYFILHETLGYAKARISGRI